MKKKFWKNFFGGRSGKRFSAWQIELTTRCPLRCRMCCREGHPVLARKDMSLEDFKRLLPYMKEVEAVVLEGWGESLLHPNLVECIRLVKGAGTQVGFVTGGKTLNRAYISELVRAKTDFIGFSLSGATAATHDSIRINSNLPELLEHIQVFKEIKARERSPYPRLHIVYLLLKDNIAEVPALIRLAQEWKIEEVVLIHIALVSTAWQEAQRIFGLEQAEDYNRIIREAQRLARDFRIRLVIPPLAPQDVAVCSENPLRNLYISVDGDVSPCVYLHPPLLSPFRRIFHGAEHPTEKVIFGNILRDPFDGVWANPSYEEFRECFAQRLKKFDDLYASIWTGDKPRGGDWPISPSPPGPCRSCYKIEGA
jgi:MoaA/NifB/PqqE/SkfB family radical SAM enzyme